MKIVFFGVTKYSYELLEALLQNDYDVSVIFTTPEEFEISYAEKPVKIYNYANLKEFGEKFAVPVIEVNGNINSYYNDFKKYSPDVILVLGWYYMMPRAIREIPPMGCIGIHSSLLPMYAGGAPLVWAIIKGENETGITLFHLEEGVDTGDIIAQERFSIEYNDDISTVYRKATASSKKILLEYLPKIANGTAPRKHQDLSQRTVYPQRSPKDGEIDWTKSAEEIRDFIRAQTKPYPGAFTYIGNKKVTVWKAEVVERYNDNISKSRSHHIIKTGQGNLRIVDCHPKDSIINDSNSSFADERR